MRELIGLGKGYELIGSEFTYLLLFVNFKGFFESVLGFSLIFDSILIPPTLSFLVILKSYASLTLSLTCFFHITRSRLCIENSS